MKRRTFTCLGRFLSVVALFIGGAALSAPPTVSINPAVSSSDRIHTCEGAACFKVDFTAQATDPDGGTIVAYQWSFGNGQTDDKPAPSADYLNIGLYPVSLVVTDAQGEKGQASAVVLVSGCMAILSGTTNARSYCMFDDDRDAVSEKQWLCADFDNVPGTLPPPEGFYGDQCSLAELQDFDGRDGFFVLVDGFRYDAFLPEGQAGRALAVPLATGTGDARLRLSMPHFLMSVDPCVAKDDPAAGVTFRIQHGPGTPALGRVLMDAGLMTVQAQEGGGWVEGAFSLLFPAQDSVSFRIPADPSFPGAASQFPVQIPISQQYSTSILILSSSISVSHNLFGGECGVLADVAYWEYLVQPLSPTPLLLRRSTDNRWFQYQLSGSDVLEKGFQSLTRSPAYSVVSREDFDGDGQPDLLLRDLTPTREENGRWVLYTFVGNTVTSQGFMDAGLTRNADWQVVSTRDVDGDGKADLLLRNAVDGRWLLYLLDRHLIKSQALMSLSADLGDTLQGVGDFNADGRADVLLRRGDGSWLVYLLDGLSAPVQGSPAMTANLGFSVQSLGDFNGDGKTDVLLRRGDGRWFQYLLDGISVLGSGSPGMTEAVDFALDQVADFSGDGKSDVLLRRQSDGRWFLYVLDGPAITASGAPEMTGNLAFEIVSTQDFTGDGKADALMRRSDGRWVLYGLDGPLVISKGIPDLTRNVAWTPYVQ